jgi:glyoxalase family protein
MKILGLHHVTAIASNAQQNVRFYTQVLGLRLIKKTVNFDDPSTYHLYYGDSVGTPGSVLTFFPWAGIRRGRVGTGQASATAFSVPVDALPFWSARLKSLGVNASAPFARFGDTAIRFEDPDGLVLEIVASAEPDARAPFAHPEIPYASGIRGFHSVTLAVSQTAPTVALLTAMGYRVVAESAGRTRLAAGNGGPGTYVDLVVDPSLPRGLSGGGTVHHVAFRVADDDAQSEALRQLRELGLHVSPVMDRNYFHSIYYREPAGVLFEIATDSPGFAIDETVETLGSTLKLPAQYEDRRREIEAALPPLV